MSPLAASFFSRLAHVLLWWWFRLTNPAWGTPGWQTWTLRGLGIAGLVGAITFLVAVSVEGKPAQDSSGDASPMSERGISLGWLAFLVGFAIPSIAALLALIVVAAPFEGLIVVAALVLAPAFVSSDMRAKGRRSTPYT